MISWEMIAGCFGQQEYEWIYEGNRTRVYWSKQIFYKGMKVDDDVLYIIYSSHFQDEIVSDNMSAIIFQDEFEHEIVIPKKTGNLLCIKNSELAEQAIMRLDELFQDQYRVGHILSVIQSMIVNNVGVQCIIEKISQFFKTPISLLDTTFRFIAKSESYKPDYAKSFLPEVHDKEGFDKGILEFFRKEGVLEKLIHSVEPFEYSIFSEKAYFIPVVISNIKVAYLIIYSNNPETQIGKQYDTYFSLFANTLSIEMAKDNFYLFNKGNYYNYIFSLILSEENIELEDIRMRLKIYDYTLYENMYLIEIDTEMYRNIAAHKDRIAESIRKVFRNSFYVFRNDKIFFLISRQKCDLITQREMDTWEISLKTQKLVAAITGPFYNFARIKEQIKKVDLVLEAVKRKKLNKYVYSFENSQIWAMLSCVDRKEDISMFLYSPVLDVIDYDRKNGTELEKTLKEYLKQPKNINEVCEKLCIHKNTLYKRLDRIYEIMQCDYHNGNIIMRIEITFEILEMSGGVL